MIQDQLRVVDPSDDRRPQLTAVPAADSTLSPKPSKAHARIRLDVLDQLSLQLPPDESQRLLLLAATRPTLFVSEVLALSSAGMLTLPRAHLRLLAADLERPVTLRSVRAR